MKLEDVARLAGVSKTTASYVINGKASQYRISAETVCRVMSVVEAYGYQPDLAATALRSGSSRLLGFVMPDLANQSYAHLAKLLEARARAAGFQLLITGSEDDAGVEIDLVNMLLARRIDGLLVASALTGDHSFYARIVASGVPVIALDRAMDETSMISVVSEEQSGAEMLTRSLLDEEVEGRGQIGLLGAREELVVSRLRAQGFMAAIDNTRWQGSSRYAASFSREAGAALCAAWLEQGVLPNHLVTTSYPLMEGVLDVLLAHPERLATMRLATFGDHRLLDFLPVRINALPQQFELLADSAMALMLSALAGEYRPGIHVIPRLLRVRGGSR